MRYLVGGSKTDGSANGEKAVEVARIHGVETSECVGDETSGNNEHIFEQDIGGVFLTGESRFQGGKPEVHDEDERRGHQDPQIVYHEFGIGNGHLLKGLDRGDFCGQGFSSGKNCHNK